MFNAKAQAIISAVVPGFNMFLDFRSSLSRVCRLFLPLEVSSPWSSKVVLAIKETSCALSNVVFRAIKVSGCAERTFKKVS